MNKEFEFLNIISDKLSDNTYLGDDCAYLKELGIVVSSDSLIEDVHFSLSFMNSKEIAKKALLVNISDILASGAKPKYFSINLSGSLTNEFIEEFYQGVDEIAKEFDIKIIGGDLTKSDKIMISITAIGVVENRKISSRKNAKSNYIVAVCGEFGTSAKGLDELLNNKKDSYFIGVHKKPKLYPEISNIISLNAQKPYAMMDSSDCLIDCLTQISSKSSVKIEIDYEKIPKKDIEKDFVLYGGEDYCLVCCLDENDFNRISKKTDKLIKIGICSTGKGVSLDNQEIKYDKGFRHFE